MTTLEIGIEDRAGGAVMAGSAAKALSQLASLALELERRRSSLSTLQYIADSMQSSGTNVVGEQWLLEQLAGKLDEAITAFESIRSIQSTQAAAEQLSLLETTLNGPEWDAAGEVINDLSERQQRQQEQVQEISDMFAEWQSDFTRLTRRVEEARRARAPIRREEIEVVRLQALRERAERALRDRQFTALINVAAQLAESADMPESLLEQVAGKTKATRDFTRQGDLLLLQSPLVNERYEYTVLLRTPSEPGTHSINIQDSSTISQQDRDQMGEIINRVTVAVNSGLQRSFNARGAPSTGDGHAANGDASTVEDRQDGTFAASDAVTTRVTDGSSQDSARHIFSTGPLDAGLAAPDIAVMAQDVGDLMYRLFMPEPMQQYLTSNPCSLTITTNDLELPWELMWNRDRFLCLERPVARLPMGRAFPRTQPSLDRSGRKLRFLLIYADPQRNLPAGKQEVERIQQGLQEKWGDDIEVNALYADEAQGRTVNESLRKGQYDVIHYAGHAAFNQEDPDLSGLLLHDNEVFFAQKIRRLLEGRPLVFLNACESGRTANEENPQVVSGYFQKPAEGLASAFIYGGALGCIGSLWPVYDQPAAEFAVHFYNLVLEGHMIGEAMRLARIQSRADYPRQITWASFALYGDPTFRLVD